MMDGVVVNSMIQRTKNIEVPQDKETYVCKAAQFFSPDYAQQMLVQEWK